MLPLDMQPYISAEPNYAAAIDSMPNGRKNTFLL